MRQFDVVVMGGGPGGICAAVAAADAGASVLLIEKYGFLGGMATAGLVNPFMPYKIKGKRLTSAVFNELLGRLRDERALADGDQIFDDEGMKIVLDQMMIPQNVDNLLIGSRCINAMHEAHSSLRVMPVVAGIGEAAGLAAAWAVRDKIVPRDIDGSLLKATILGKDNAPIPGT